MNSDLLLNSLNKEQRGVVSHVEGPALVIAGPGSGKTRALTHKIAYLIEVKKVHPDEILAVTFTNKAASEMKERVVKLLKEDVEESKDFSGVKLESSITPHWIGTFHSMCAKILRDESHYLEVSKGFVIYDTEDSKKLIKEIMDELDMPVRDITPKSVLAGISRAKAEMMGPKMFAEQSQSYYYQRISELYPIYQKRLRENNAMDFSDLLFETVKLLQKNEELLKKYQGKFTHILVDEYQDTNRVQYQLVKMLAKNHRNLTVVGDISQSIYSWRGADYRNMMQFEKDYPDAKIYKLAKNYRSTSNILHAAKEVIENNDSHIEIDLYTDNKPGAKIRLYEAEHEKGEAQYVTDMISHHVSEPGVYEAAPGELGYKDFAVLYRTNAQSRVIEEAFVYQGLPYRIIGGVKFYDRREIKDAIAYLRVFQNPLDTVSWGRCINTPPRKIGKKALEKIKASDYDLDFIEDMTKLPWKKYVLAADENTMKPIELLDVVLKDFGYVEYLDDGTEEGIGRIENLKELRTVARQFDSLTEFLEQIALVEASNRAENKDDDSVVLMTLHSAKGLEFENVFIVGLEEGVFPHSRSMADENELEEERRLCYVGMTRAKKNLHLTYTRRRTYFGSTGAAITSRFISEIPEQYLDFRFG